MTPDGPVWELQGQTVDVAHVWLDDRDPIAVPEIDRADRDAWDAWADRGPDERTAEERAADVAALEGPFYTFELGDQERER